MYIIIKIFASCFLQMCSELTVPFLRRAHLKKSLLLSFGQRLEDDGMKTDSMRLNLSSLIHATFKISNVLQASIPQQCVYVIVVGLPFAAFPRVSTHVISWRAPVTQNMST